MNMKKYQVPQIEEMKVEKLMNDNHASGGPTPSAPQRINNQYTV